MTSSPPTGPKSPHPWGHRWHLLKNVASGLQRERAGRMGGMGGSGMRLEHSQDSSQDTASAQSGLGTRMSEHPPHVGALSIPHHEHPEHPEPLSTLPPRRTGSSLAPGDSSTPWIPQAFPTLGCPQHPSHTLAMGQDRLRAHRARTPCAQTQWPRMLLLPRGFCLQLPAPASMDPFISLHPHGGIPAGVTGSAGPSSDNPTAPEPPRASPVPGLTHGTAATPAHPAPILLTSAALFQSSEQHPQGSGTPQEYPG